MHKRRAARAPRAHLTRRSSRSHSALILAGGASHHHGSSQLVASIPQFRRSVKTTTRESVRGYWSQDTTGPVAPLDEWAPFICCSPYAHPWCLPRTSASNLMTVYHEPINTNLSTISGQTGNRLPPHLPGSLRGYRLQGNWGSRGMRPSGSGPSGPRVGRRSSVPERYIPTANCTCCPGASTGSSNT